MAQAIRGGVDLGFFSKLCHITDENIVATYDQDFAGDSGYVIVVDKPVFVQLLEIGELHEKYKRLPYSTPVDCKNYQQFVKDAELMTSNPLDSTFVRLPEAGKFLGFDRLYITNEKIAKELLLPTEPYLYPYDANISIDILTPEITDADMFIANKEVI